MAQKQSKNRKFDRNRKRSGSMANYRSSNKQLTNKLRKLRNHIKNNPQDAVAEATLKAGGTGPAAKWPAAEKPDVKERAVMDHPVSVDWSKRRNMFLVYSEHQLVQITPVFDEAMSAYRGLHTQATLCKREGNLIAIIKSKRSTPIVHNTYKLRELLNGKGSVLTNKVNGPSSTRT